MGDILNICQRLRVCDVCQRYNMPEGRPLANMGGGLRRNGASRSRKHAVI